MQLPLSPVPVPLSLSLILFLLLSLFLILFLFLSLCFLCQDCGVWRSPGQIHATQTYGDAKPVTGLRPGPPLLSIVTA